MPEFFWPSLATVTPIVGIWFLRGFLGGFELFLVPLLCWEVDRRGLVESRRITIVLLGGLVEEALVEKDHLKVVDDPHRVGDAS